MSCFATRGGGHIQNQITRMQRHRVADGNTGRILNHETLRKFAAGDPLVGSGYRFDH